MDAEEFEQIGGFSDVTLLQVVIREAQSRLLRIRVSSDRPLECRDCLSLPAVSQQIVAEQCLEACPRVRIGFEEALEPGRGIGIAPQKRKQIGNA